MSWLVENSDWIDIWARAALPGVITALVILALYFHERQFKVRTQKREQTERELLLFQKFALETRDLAKEYWMTYGQMEESEWLARTISCRVNFLWTFVDDVLGYDINGKSKVVREMRNLQEAHTGGQFLVKGRLPSGERLPEIENATLRVISATNSHVRIS